MLLNLRSSSCSTICSFLHQKKKKKCTKKTKTASHRNRLLSALIASKTQALARLLVLMSCSGTSSQCCITRALSPRTQITTFKDHYAIETRTGSSQSLKSRCHYRMASFVPAKRSLFVLFCFFPPLWQTHKSTVETLGEKKTKKIENC